MDDLIARLKKATGPDRGLDGDIAVACGGATGFTERFGRRDDGWVSRGPHHAVVSAPAYTASVDAALTLVPPHHLWELKQGIEARAIVWRLETDYDDDGAPTGYSTTFPAIALCIAALHARAAR